MHSSVLNTADTVSAICVYMFMNGDAYNNIFSSPSSLSLSSLGSLLWHQLILKNSKASFTVGTEANTGTKADTNTVEASVSAKDKILLTLSR